MAELLLHGLQLLLLLHVGVREIVDRCLVGGSSIGEVLDAFISTLLGVLVFFCIAAESEFSCFRRYFVTMFISQLEEILESGKGLGRFTLPVQVGLIESLTPLDAN